eukprot:3438940-Lingulodinium_polyedra.AAC.1
MPSTQPPRPNVCPVAAHARDHRSTVLRGDQSTRRARTGELSCAKGARSGTSRKRPCAARACTDGTSLPTWRGAGTA